MIDRSTVTRERLLDAASELFAEKGFEGARVDRISRRARVNKAMIYYHFRTKKGLYQAVLLNSFSLLRQTLERAATREDAAPADRLSGLVHALAQIASERPALPRILVREILADGRHLSPQAARALTEMFHPFRATVDEGISQGAFREADPLLVQIHLVASIMLFFASKTFRARLLTTAGADLKPPDAEKFVFQLDQILIRGLTSDQAASTSSAARRGAPKSSRKKGKS